MLRDNLFNLVGRSEDQRHALMHRLRHNIENVANPVAGAAAGLLGKEGHRRGFIDKAQPPLAIAVAAVGKIQKDTATAEDPPCVGDQRSDPAEAEIRPRGPSAPATQSAT